MFYFAIVDGIKDIFEISQILMNTKKSKVILKLPQIC
jgi:hypothetical protein